MTKYAWIDLETTGLDAEKGQILEIACIVTDNKLNQEYSFDSVVRPNPRMPLEMDNFVKNMHTENGLLDELERADQNAYHVGVALANVLKSFNNGNPKEILMCGNSIASLDIPFLRKHMPAVMDQLHYRTIDITAVRLGLELLMDEKIPVQKRKGHRALDDVRECIQEFQEMRNYAQGRLL